LETGSSLKIYTRTGDAGSTGLFGGGRVSKGDIRVEAYGEVDELNASIGVAIAALGAASLPSSPLMIEGLRRVQVDLFPIGAYLATPGADGSAAAARHLPPLPSGEISALEEWIDAATARLPELKSFILPGGSVVAAELHRARTVCRRAERRVTQLSDEATVEGSVLAYLNRLSDLLFTLARLANLEAGAEDVPWSGRR